MAYRVLLLALIFIGCETEPDWSNVKVDWATNPNHGKHWVVKIDTAYVAKFPEEFWNEAKNGVRLGLDLTVLDQPYIPQQFKDEYGERLKGGEVIVVLAKVDSLNNLSWRPE